MGRVMDCDRDKIATETRSRFEAHGCDALKRSVGTCLSARIGVAQCVVGLAFCGAAHL